MRCRTCCKSRGFQCPTHVKSTWIPVSKRRHTAAARHRLSSYPINRHLPPPPPPQNPPFFGSAEESNFPAEVSFPAVFRCVRVSSVDSAGGEDTNCQYAYQTAVNIAGHVFKGILYDQGPESRYNTPEEGSSAAAARLQQLGHLVGGDATAAASNNNVSPPQPPPHPSYHTPFTTTNFMPTAAHFFPYPKS
ncbi:unnamed protein product [Cuscuta campestris]|uniref:Uncharacterized protein n=1 Tax=Cuscuta campestris TaxID=132261 RepID=A0A484KRS0_9ASTE|nr:unnamed protein product [Cuscuta campestris]